MDPAWKFEHTIETRASRNAAWSYWSNVNNWTSVDPAVEWARLDGPFITGTRGETKPVGAPATQWVLSEVEPGKRAIIELAIPGAVVRFVWTFADINSGGAILTQAVELVGEGVEQYAAGMQQLEENIPAGMAKLASAIDRFAVESTN
jgi:hypothetical protein